MRRERQLAEERNRSGDKQGEKNEKKEKTFPFGVWPWKPEIIEYSHPQIPSLFVSNPNPNSSPGSGLIHQRR